MKVVPPSCIAYPHKERPGPSDDPSECAKYLLELLKSPSAGVSVSQLPLSRAMASKLELVMSPQLQLELADVKNVELEISGFQVS